MREDIQILFDSLLWCNPPFTIRTSLEVLKSHFLELQKERDELKAELEKLQKQPSSESIQQATSAWCQKSTQNKVMDVELVREFALILDQVKEKSITTDKETKPCKT